MDGTKIRAQASGKSFRREKTLREHLELARQRVKELFNSNQVGGFWGVSANFPSYQATPTAGAIVAQPNEVRVFQFTLPFAVTIGRLTLEVFRFGTSTTDIGLYNAAGNRILYTGGFGTSSVGAVNPAIVGAPVLVPAGVYYFAQTSTNNVITFRQLTAYLGTVFASTNAQRYGIAANVATNGVLPTTLGNFGGFMASHRVSSLRWHSSSADL